MNAHTAFKEEIAEHERNAGESDPVLVSVCIGRAAMRFRAELDYAHGEYDIEYDGDGFLCSLLLGLMHWTASAKFNDPRIPALNFDEELERARAMFKDDTNEN